MASPFEVAFETSAEPQHDAWFGTSIQIRRGVSITAAFTATWSVQEYQSIEAETGLAIAVKKRVYRFKKSLAVLAGEEFEPKRGDEIIDGDETLTILPVQDRPAVESEPDRKSVV